MWSSFDIGALLLVFAVVVTLLNDRTLRLPRPIALLIAALVASAGIILTGALAPHANLAGRAEQRLLGADLPSVLLDGVLALLLFATSLNSDIHELRKQARLIFWLATLGVGLAMVLFGFGIHLVLGLAGIDVPLAWCLVLGAILAPTDAVAVEQLLSGVRMPENVRSLISGESLFNDGAAVVFFFAALAAATGGGTEIGNGHMVLKLVVEGGGGAVLGLLAGLLARLAMRFARDPDIAVTITLALVLATYRSAVMLEISGPIAVVVAGLTMRNWPAPARQAFPWRRRVRQFWAMTDELVNTLLFLLMGFEVLEIPLAGASALAVVAAIPLALAVRLVSVSVPVLLARRAGIDRLRTIGVLTWTGLRGGISIALVLALPPSPFRETLAVICYGVVIFSVIIQGLTTPRLVAWIYRGSAEDAGRQQA